MGKHSMRFVPEAPEGFIYLPHSVIELTPLADKGDRIQILTRLYCWLVCKIKYVSCKLRRRIFDSHTDQSIINFLRESNIIAKEGKKNYHHIVKRNYIFDYDSNFILVPIYNLKHINKIRGLIG